MRKIIGLGETVLDIIFRDEQPVKAVPGGSAFNAIVSVGRTRTPCIMITEVGDDKVGDIVTRFLERNNVDTSYVYRAAGTQSHLSLAFLDKNNDAQYQFYKDHAALSMRENFPEVNPGDIVLFGSFFSINPSIREFVSEFLQMARKAGALLYYDLNFRASHVRDIPQVEQNIRENMQLATVVRGSAEDFSLLYGLDTAEKVYIERVAALCPNFIYTDSSKPVRVFTPVFEGSFPAKPIETVSTIGAGDNFNAGFCYALYQSGITSAESLSALTSEGWTPLVATAQKFSSAVCQSLDNYIPENFAL